MDSAIWRAGIALALVLGCFVAGCATSKPKSDRLESLLHQGRGQSQQEVERIFGPSQHEFTAQIGDEMVRCVAVPFGWKGTYYFVFTNDVLGKICEPPPSDYRRVPYKGTWAQILDHSDPEGRMRKVFVSPDLDGSELSDTLAQRGPPEPGPTGEKVLWIIGMTMMSPYVIPYAMVVAPYGAIKGANRRAEERAIAQQFDPQKVKPGMSVGDVGEALGKPYLIDAVEGEREIHYYGSVKVYTAHWISVVFENGRATRVFTREFFDLNKIYPR